MANDPHQHSIPATTNLKHTHIQLHLLKNTSQLIDLLQHLHLMLEHIPFLYGNLSQIDQDLLNGNIPLTPQLQLDLHTLDQHLIHLLIIGMKLPLLIVNPVQKIFYIRHLRQPRREKLQQPIIKLIPQA